MINADALKRIVGEDYVVTQRDQIQGYLADETYLGVLPKPAEHVIVVKPANPQEISAILKLANETKTPVYPRGGGTGLVGGCVPTRDGVVLSLERLDKIIEVDKDNMMVVAEGGVTLEHLLKEVEDKRPSVPATSRRRRRSGRRHDCLQRRRHPRGQIRRGPQLRQGA